MHTSDAITTYADRITTTLSQRGEQVALAILTNRLVEDGPLGVSEFSGTQEKAAVRRLAKAGFVEIVRSSGVRQVLGARIHRDHQEAN